MRYFKHFPVGSFGDQSFELLVTGLLGISNACMFQVLGVSPIEGFEKVKQVYTRKRKEADKRGDEATATLVGYNSLKIELLLRKNV